MASVGLKGGFLRDFSPLGGRSYRVLFVLFILFYCASFTLWASTPCRMVFWDGLAYLNASFEIYDALSQDATDFPSIFLNTVTLRKPPAFPILMAFGHFLLGKSIQSAWALMLGCVLLMCYFLYRIGVCLGNPRIGVVASVLMLGFYPFQHIPAYLGVEIPMTTVLIICVYLTLKTDSLRNTRETVLLGIFLGLGFLTRLEFILFYLPFGIPCLYSFLKENRGSKPDGKNPPRGNYGRFLANILLLTAITAILTAPWLLHNLNEALLKTTSLAYNTQMDSFMGRMLDASSILYYPKAYYNFSPVLFSLSVIALAYSLADRQKRGKSERYLSYAVIIAYIAYQTVRVKATRFLIPIIPLLGVQTGILLARMKDKRIADAVFIIILAASTMNVYNYFLTFKDGRLMAKQTDPATHTILGIMDVIRDGYDADYRPRNASANVTIISEVPLGANMVTYFSNLWGLHLKASRPVVAVTSGVPYDMRAFDYDGMISSSDFIVRSSNTECSFTYMDAGDCNAFVQNMHKAFDAQRNRFERIGSVKSDLKGEIEIFERKPDDPPYGRD